MLRGMPRPIDLNPPHPAHPMHFFFFFFCSSPGVAHAEVNLRRRRHCGLCSPHDGRPMMQDVWTVRHIETRRPSTVADPWLDAHRHTHRRVTWKAKPERAGNPSRLQLRGRVTSSARSQQSQATQRLCMRIGCALPDQNLRRSDHGGECRSRGKSHSRGVVVMAGVKNTRAPDDHGCWNICFTCVRYFSHTAQWGILRLKEWSLGDLAHWAEPHGRRAHRASDC